MSRTVQRKARGPVVVEDGARPGASQEPRLWASDFVVFQRYPVSVRWTQVLPADQERYRRIRGWLRRFARALAQRLPGMVRYGSGVAVLNPGGNSRAELAAWVLPADAPHRQGALQWVVSVHAGGLDLGLSVGPETTRLQDPALQRRVEDYQDFTRERLDALPMALVTAVETSLEGSWRALQLGSAGGLRRELHALHDWVAYAASAEGRGAFWCTRLEPAAAEALGGELLEWALRRAAVFVRWMDAVYGPAARALARDDGELLAGLGIPGDDGGDGAEGQGAGTASGFVLPEAMETLLGQLEAQGFVYQPWQVAAYVTALRTRPFVILAGPTGMGKSRLPSLVAAATGSELLPVPVRPDWTDSAELLGYQDVQGQFRPGSLLRLARKATAWPQAHFVYLLDEMNLARVEHYLAEVLSRLEERRVGADGWTRTGPLVLAPLRDGDGVWNSIELPGNLSLVGTVNMDESTQSLSRKVLDRAFCMELLAGELQRWRPGSQARAVASGPAWPVHIWRPRALQLSQVEPRDAAEAQRIDALVAVLAEVDALLAPAQQPVGFRTRDDVVLFVLQSAGLEGLFCTREGLGLDPLDLALTMKVLPRVSGSSRALRRALAALLGYFLEGKGSYSEEDARARWLQWDRGGRGTHWAGARFPWSTARLCVLWERLQEDGFASFW